MLRGVADDPPCNIRRRGHGLERYRPLCNMDGRQHSVLLIRGRRLQETDFQYPEVGRVQVRLQKLLIIRPSLSVFLGFAAGSTYFDKILIQYYFDSNEGALFFGSQRSLMILTAVASAVSMMLFPFLSERNSHMPIKETSHIATRHCTSH